MRIENRRWITFAAAGLFGLVAAGCFGGDDQEADFENVREGLEDAAQGLGDAADAMRDAMGGMTEGTVEKPINFRELQEFLAEELGGFERASREGSTSGAMGMDVSTAKAAYEMEEGGRVEVEILDLGAVGGPALMGLAAWTNMSVDLETDRGWERTTEYEGYPVFEKFTRSGDSDRGRGEFSAFIERRFIVKVTGRDVTWTEIEDVIRDIDLDDLADLRDEEG